MTKKEYPEDFLKWFMGVCSKTNIDKSQEEELYRYHNRAPYHERFCKWVDKFYLPNKDTDFSGDHSV